MKLVKLRAGLKPACYVNTKQQFPVMTQKNISLEATVNVRVKSSTLNPVIDICMLDGSNLGTGGNQYAASYSGGSFSKGKFTITNNGYLTVPTPMLASTEPWTVAFTIDGYTVNSSHTYCRVARGGNDVPSIFYTKSVDKFQTKMANASANTSASGLVVVDTNNVEVLSSGACLFSIDKNTRNTFVFRNDGEYISLWINGTEYMREATNNYSEVKYTSTFSIGDNASAGYDMYNLICSMLKVWDRALSIEEISGINL